MINDPNRKKKGKQHVDPNKGDWDPNAEDDWLADDTEDYEDYYEDEEDFRKYLEDDRY
jgi:hypothetical protein